MALSPGDPLEYKEGQNYMGGKFSAAEGTVGMPGTQRGAINTWHEGNAHGVVVALDP
jgi:hypothetical protein